MPFRVMIPDVCDRYGCSGPEAVAIIMKTMGIERNDPMLVMPTPFNRWVSYRNKETNEVAIEVEYYVVDTRPQEGKETKS
jgi:hypothetical protein